jgi:NADPH:quinone reductase-like Zn-dependent oxidoreductase
MNFKRVVITKYGSPDVLKVVEENELPEPGKEEVRIKVLVVSASFTDTLLRKGMYPDVRNKPPFSPGYDLVGIVDKCGEDSFLFKPGQRVAALTIYGSYTEYICLPQNSLVPVPEGLDSGEAVALILSYMTAYQMLHRTAKIQTGQSILVHGAGGAVGTALLQLGKLLNLKMYGTARKSKHALVESLGAAAIDYETEDYVERVSALSGTGVDAVFDGIGGDYFKRSFSVLKPGGILVAYGFQKAVLGNENILKIVGGFMLLKLLDLLPNKKRAVFYNISSLRKKNPAWFTDDLTELFELLRQKKIKPVISRRMPLAQAAEAHRLLDQSKVEGKIILTVSGK